MGTVPQNMSPTTDIPGASRLLSTLLPSLMLASSRVTWTEHDPGDAVNKTIEKIENTEMERETIDSLAKSEEKILRSVRYKNWLATDNFNILTTSQHSSENENQKNAEAHRYFLAPVGSAEFIAPEIEEAFIEDTGLYCSYQKTLGVMILLSGSCGHQCDWAAGGTYDFCQLNLFNNIQQGKFEWLDNNYQTALVTPPQIRNVEALPSYLACSILLCFLLFPSLSENKKYQANFDCHESCHLQTSAMSKVFSDKIQSFEI